MTNQEIVSDSLKKGTGRALLVIRDNQDIDFSEIIFNACINALGYDPQCEGNRAEYLYEIIQASSQKLLLEDKLTEAILSDEIEGWDLIQLFGVAKIFAEKGNKIAHANLYKKLSSNQYDDYQISGILQELVNLDGLDALKLIAEIRGKKILNSEFDWEGDYLLKYYTKEINSTVDPYRYLQELAVDNQYIQVFLNRIEECKKNRDDSPEVEWTYELIKKRIQKDGSGLYGLSKWINLDIMRQIAEDFIKENDIKVARNYIRFFANHEFPLDFKYLIPFTNDSDEITRHYALESLSFFKDICVREIALSKLNQRVDIEPSLEILVNNFQDEDCKLLEQILIEQYTLNQNDLEQDYNHGFHRVSGIVNDIYEKNNSSLSFSVLQYCYKFSHCSICRRETVEIMLRNNFLPDWIREEALYDCNFDIRALVEGC